MSNFSHENCGPFMTSRDGKKMGYVGTPLLATPAVLVILALIASLVIDASQTTTSTSSGALLHFELASVKVNTSGDRAYVTQYLPGGRFVARNVPVGFLVLEAFNTTGQRLGGNLPKTVDPRVLNQRYDIEATAERGLIPSDSAKVRDEKLRLMLQT